MTGQRWSDVANEEFCYLTTTGRISGKPHTIEIWFAVAEETAYLLSGGRDQADWVRNLRADPRVIIRIAGADHAATARIVTGFEESAMARQLLYDKYNPRYGGDLATWRDTALPVAVDPSPS